jgi:hypothetical protein
MKASEMIAAALASLDNLTPFVRDDGNNYLADARNTLNVALTTATAEEATPPAAPLDASVVMAAIDALSAKVDALKPAGA